jgi:hypothetical protein
MTERIIVRWLVTERAFPAAVDALIPVSRGVDKLRTICGHLCVLADWGAPAAMPPTVDCPGPVVQDTIISKGGNIF